MGEPTQQGEGTRDPPKRRGIDEAAGAVQVGGVLQQRGQCVGWWRLQLALAAWGREEGGEA
jgi:hypothetical protein